MKFVPYVTVKQSPDAKLYVICFKNTFESQRKCQQVFFLNAINFIKDV